MMQSLGMKPKAPTRGETTATTPALIPHSPTLHKREFIIQLGGAICIWLLLITVISYVFCPIIITFIVSPPLTTPQPLCIQFTIAPHLDELWIILMNLIQQQIDIATFYDPLIFVVLFSVVLPSALSAKSHGILERLAKNT